MVEPAAPDISPARFTKRLWQFAFAVALWSILIAVAGVVTGTVASRATSGTHFLDRIGGDFLAFYTAGHFVRTGQADLLYSTEAVATFQRDLSQTVPIAAEGAAPWWNPPQFALPFVPLSLLWFQHALIVWYAILLAALAASIAIVIRLVNCSGSNKLLVAILVLVAPATHQALTHGQSTPLSLLILSSAVVLAIGEGSRRAVLAGLVLSLLFYKPQLAVVAAIALVCLRGRHAFLGLLIGGLTQVLAVMLIMPGSLHAFALDMPAALHAFQSNRPYDWHRHATALSMYRQLVQGPDAGETLPIVKTLTQVTAAVAGLCLLTLGVLWRRHAPRQRDIRPPLALAILATPIIVPFYFDYDLMLFAIPAAIFARLHAEGTVRITTPVLVLSGLLYFSLGFDQQAIYNATSDWLPWLSHVNLRAVLVLAIFVLTGRAVMRATVTSIDDSTVARRTLAVTTSSNGMIRPN